MLMPSAHGSARALLKTTFVSEVFKDMVDQRFAGGAYANRAEGELPIAELAAPGSAALALVNR
jgi:hypothetical protein